MTRTGGLVEGKIEDRSQTLLAGLSFFGNPFAQSAGWTEENEIGRLWARFMQLRADSPESFPPPLAEGEMYELHLPDPRTNQTGEYEVFIGYPVGDAAGVPLPLVTKTVPAARFARFTLAGPSIVESDSYQQMYDWISVNGLAPLADWMFNLYDSRFKSMDRLEESELDVCIPVHDARDAD
jgi:predicted transcriptional regulator YdeE